jgi:streptogramin lyase
MRSLSWSGVIARYFQKKLSMLFGALLGMAPVLAAALTVLVLGLRPSVAQETSPVSFGPISVPGTAVIFGPDNVLTANQLDALGSNGPLGASPAVEALAFTATTGQRVIFSASGLVGCCSVVNIGPDGYSGSLSNLEALESISGYEGPSMALVGVFTNGGPKGAAPVDYNYSQGFGQAKYAPQLNQVFFIGDGLTGTGSGSTQIFQVPASATELWLGFADGQGFTGPPADYGDNPGGLSVSGTLNPSDLAQVSTPLLQFGIIPFGTTKTLPLTITNIGAGTLTVSPSIAGQSFMIAGNTCGGGLTTNQSCVLQVEFSPVTAGTHNEVLTLQTNGPTNPTVALKGIADVVVPPGTPPAGQVSTTYLPFGTVPLGTSETQPVTIINIGGGTLTVTPSISGYSTPPPSTFNYTIVGNTCGAGVASGGSCVLQIQFSPTSIATHDDFLTVSTNGGNFTVDLVGKVAGLSVLGGANYGTLKFGSVALDSTEVEMLTVTNVGLPDTVTMGTAIHAGSGAGPYTVLTTAKNTCLTGVAPGQSCILPIEFAPTSSGIHDDLLTLTPSAGGGKTAVWLEGSSGVAVTFAGTSPAVNFGSVNVCPPNQTNPAPCSQTLTLTYNVTGTGSVTLGTPQALTLGAPNLDFTVASDTCSGAVESGTTCVVKVTFAPIAPGLRRGAVALQDASGNRLVTTDIYGTGTGPAIASALQPSSPLGLYSNFGVFHQGVSVDGFGNLFICDTNNNAVKEVLAADGYTTVLTLGSGFDNPWGTAVDGSGNVFVAGHYDKSVKEILAAGGYTTVLTLGSGFIQPTGVAVDGSGNVFVSDEGTNKVYEILAATGYTTVNNLGSGFNRPAAVAVDANDNVFVADWGNSAVKEILAAGGYTTIKNLGSGFIEPIGVALEPSGNLFVADFRVNNGAVFEILAPGGYTTVNSLGNFYGATDVAVDANGNLFVTDFNTYAVDELRRSLPSAFDFAYTPVGSTSSPQSVIVENIGNQPFTGTAVFSNADFVPATGSGTPEDCTAAVLNALALGLGCNLSISFTPQSAGLLTGTLTLSDTSGRGNPSSQTIGLYGTSLEGVIGSGKQVNLSPAVNNTGIYTDGTTFNSGGLDGAGNAYSAEQLGSTLAFNNVLFAFGTPNQANVVKGGNSVTITLPSGKYSKLYFLGTAVGGSQAKQSFTVKYASGSPSTFSQGLGDWFFGPIFSGESKAKKMSYRDTSYGGKDDRTFYLYEYSFSLDNTRDVSSFVLPNDSDVAVLAVTLVP